MCDVSVEATGHSRSQFFLSTTQALEMELYSHQARQLNFVKLFPLLFVPLAHSLLFVTYFF